MELYDLSTPAEERLARLADERFAALGGTFELTPLCNMECKMCYVRLSRAQMQAQGRMLTGEEWLAIARQARERGVLFLLLTGGEPLLHPDFARLYTTLAGMGFILTVNTNATLLNERMADVLAGHRPRRLNITLYGADDETYGRLCGNPKGYTQVSRAVALLKERDIPFRFTCSVTPDNLENLYRIAQTAHSHGVGLTPCSYMFPPLRRGEAATRFERLTPEDAAASLIAGFVYETPNCDLAACAAKTLEAARRPKDRSGITGLTCRAGRSGFWINWKGEMLPCGMFEEPRISLLEHSFDACWQHTVEMTQRMKRSAACERCMKKEICKSCAAACLTETGSVEGKPEYLCRMTDEVIRLCLAIIEQGMKREQRE